MLWPYAFPCLKVEFCATARVQVRYPTRHCLAGSALTTHKLGTLGSGADIRILGIARLVPSLNRKVNR